MDRCKTGSASTPRPASSHPAHPSHHVFTSRSPRSSRIPRTAPHFVLFFPQSSRQHCSKARQRRRRSQQGLRGEVDSPGSGGKSASWKLMAGGLDELESRGAGRERAEEMAGMLGVACWGIGAATRKGIEADPVVKSETGSSSSSSSRNFLLRSQCRRPVVAVRGSSGMSEAAERADSGRASLSVLGEGVRGARRAAKASSVRKRFREQGHANGRRCDCKEGSNPPRSTAGEKRNLLERNDLALGSCSSPSSVAPSKEEPGLLLFGG